MPRPETMRVKVNFIESKSKKTISILMNHLIISWFLFLFLPNVCFSQETFNRETDSLALVALYNTYNGPNWINNSGWLGTGIPIDKWYGVKVANERVVELELLLDTLYEGMSNDIDNISRLSKLELIDKNGIIELHLFDVADSGNNKKSYPIKEVPYLKGKQEETTSKNNNLLKSSASESLMLQEVSFTFSARLEKEVNSLGVQHDIVVVDSIYASYLNYEYTIDNGTNWDVVQQGDSIRGLNTGVVYIQLRSGGLYSNILEFDIASECNIPVFSVKNISSCGDTFGTIEIIGLDSTKEYEYVIIPRITNNIPTIELIGDSIITLAVGGSFIDPWVYATDIEDGDISVLVSVTGVVDINTPGAYILTYNVVDSDGNAALGVNRKVNIIESLMCLDESYPSDSFWKEIRLTDGRTVSLTSLSIVKSLIDDIRNEEVKVRGASGYFRKFQNYPPLIGQYTYWARSPFCRQDFYSGSFFIDKYRGDDVLIVGVDADRRINYVEYY
jgi:hypothetical protein